jgi:hypothetical protein
MGIQMGHEQSVLGSFFWNSFKHKNIVAMARLLKTPETCSSL